MENRVVLQRFDRSGRLVSEADFSMSRKRNPKIAPVAVNVGYWWAGGTVNGVSCHQGVNGWMMTCSIKFSLLFSLRKEPSLLVIQCKMLGGLLPFWSHLTVVDILIERRDTWSALIAQHRLLSFRTGLLLWNGEKFHSCSSLFFFHCVVVCQTSPRAGDSGKTGWWQMKMICFTFQLSKSGQELQVCKDIRFSGFVCVCMCICKCRCVCRGEVRALTSALIRGHAESVMKACWDLGVHPLSF